MNTSFIAFLNKRGVACASDTDKTLYALSKREPVALAVNSYSPIPWDSIINNYLRKGEITSHDVFGDYARDFADYLATMETKPTWKDLSEDDRNIIFLGYGVDDVFPSVVDIMVKYDRKSKKLVCEFDIERSIDHNHETDFFMLSHFENTQPVIYGISDATRSRMIEEYSSRIKIFGQRIIDAVKGTEYEKSVRNAIANYNGEDDFAQITYGITGNHLQQIDTAIDSFNIEDLVQVAENFVDAKVQIDHLKNGGKGELRQTRELAVITRTEGVVWIKHSLYGK